jgi:hypothetical protein
MRSVRFAHAVVRLYPHAWRLRYEGELRALLQDHPPSLGQLFDLLRGCGSEWSRVLSDPVESPRISLLPRDGTMQLGSALLFGLFVVAVGELLRNWRPSPVTTAGLSVAMFAHLALSVRVFPVIRSRWTRYHIGVTEAWVWLMTIASLLVLERWSGAGIPSAAIDLVRAFSSFWFVSLCNTATARAFAVLRGLQAAQRDEYRMRLRLETAERYADATPAEVEMARSALDEVHDRIRRHVSELHQIPLLSLIGLRKA